LGYFLHVIGVFASKNLTTQHLLWEPQYTNFFYNLFIFLNLRYSCQIFIAW